MKKNLEVYSFVCGKGLKEVFLKKIKKILEGGGIVLWMMYLFGGRCFFSFCLSNLIYIYRKVWCLLELLIYVVRVFLVVLFENFGENLS